MMIRAETARDVQEIHRVTEEAFLNAPHTDHTEQFIVNALRQSGMLTISLVAEDSGKIVGHVAVSPVTISDGSSGWYGLGPISVDPKFQGKGIGSKLMTGAIEALKKINANGCVLLGDPDYYRRFGFIPNPDLILPDVPPEYFLALYLLENTKENASANGIVSYHQSFSATE